MSAARIEEAFLNCCAVGVDDEDALQKGKKSTDHSLCAKEMSVRTDTGRQSVQLPAMR